jgi:phosphoribosyl 1,2-cyclic phosphodiesterase
MNIKMIASGSKGNAFTVEREHDTIQIDAGKMGEADTLLITHVHGDHFKYFNRMVANGMKWWAPEPVMEQIIDNSVSPSGLIEKYQKPNGVEAFGLYHDQPCFGYIIRDGKESYCHITDTGQVDIEDYLKGHTVYSIESNYDPDALWSTSRPDWLKDRIEKTHLSNAQAIDIAEELATENTKVVQFIHMSEHATSRAITEMEHALSKLNRKYDVGIIYETEVEE